MFRGPSVEEYFIFRIESPFNVAPPVIACTDSDYEQSATQISSFFD